MPYAVSDGAQLHYRMDGTRGAPVLLLSNSLGTDLAMWEPQMAALRPHFCVVRYDSRGHGQSDVTPGPYDVAMLGRDVVALLDHVGTARASFCGLSLGGIVGMWLGINAPERIGKLVLADTAPKIGTADIWNQRIENVNKGGMAAISEGLLARWFTPGFMAREPSTVARMKAMMERQPPAGYVACCAAVRDVDLREDVARIKASTLLITGAHDPVTPPSDAALLASRIEGAKIAEVDASHLSNVEASSAFTAALASFLGG